jgi:hypothetical protein
LVLVLLYYHLVYDGHGLVYTQGGGGGWRDVSYDIGELSCERASLTIAKGISDVWRQSRNKHIDGNKGFINAGFCNYMKNVLQ